MNHRCHFLIIYPHGTEENETSIVHPSLSPNSFTVYYFILFSQQTGEMSKGSITEEEIKFQRGRTSNLHRSEKDLGSETSPLYKTMVLLAV